MFVACRTNLDLNRRGIEKWPEELPVCPQVGDLIESAHKWKNMYVLQLEVYRVTWKITSNQKMWYPEIEMHLPKGRFENLREFYKWYADITGGHVSDFI